MYPAPAMAAPILPGTGVAPKRASPSRSWGMVRHFVPLGIVRYLANEDWAAEQWYFRQVTNRMLRFVAAGELYDSGWCEFMYG